MNTCQKSKKCVKYEVTARTGLSVKEARCEIIYPMSRKHILVTGGAGYIGSVTVKKLLDAGHRITVVDNLSKGKREFVDERAVLRVLDILDLSLLLEGLKDQKFDVVMHFAALKDAGESMKDPWLYQNNIIGTVNLLRLVRTLGIKQFIFSSSAAVYGEPISDVISEEHPRKPTNFYGNTKLVGEDLLEWSRKLGELNYVALRYFNVSGDGGFSYIDPNAKNIFNVIGEVLSGQKEHLEVFGDDYDTKDGTGVRDYIHVNDIADAHVHAIDVEGSHSINLGSEKGYTVLEIIKEFERVSGEKIPYKIVGRREGDVAVAIASSEKAKKILGWAPRHGLSDMVGSTWVALKKNKRE